ncbi:hypothetical protein MFLAVUS_006473 [Mucor flavus]|uniref:Uncharacterized protein n=1 Tax=Mucor flavus TaxID=439312 RepID=A0ABP9Z1N7_9FUNG
MAHISFCFIPIQTHLNLAIAEKYQHGIGEVSANGQHALDQYASRPTEWLKFTKSDVLYTSSHSKNLNSLPPVLVEVQYSGNMSFYRRSIDYGLSVTKRHSTPPAISILLEDHQGGSSKKRAVDCLDQVLTKINQPQKKATGSILSNNDEDWKFVEKYYEDHGSLNWEAIFKLGKLNERFGNYSKWTSAKAAYYRFKKQNQ